MGSFFIALGTVGLFLVCATSAFAYLDPGTGSMILQAVLGAVFFASTAVGIFWKKIKIFFSGHSKESDTEK